jgi:hypothetical protein
MVRCSDSLSAGEDQIACRVGEHDARGWRGPAPDWPHPASLDPARATGARLGRRVVGGIRGRRRVRGLWSFRRCRGRRGGLCDGGRCRGHGCGLSQNRLGVLGGSFVAVTGECPDHDQRAEDLRRCVSPSEALLRPTGGEILGLWDRNNDCAINPFDYQYVEVWNWIVTSAALSLSAGRSLSLRPGRGPLGRRRHLLLRAAGEDPAESVIFGGCGPQPVGEFHRDLPGSVEATDRLVRR